MLRNDMSPQNKIAKRIFDFLTKHYSEDHVYRVGCDQGGTWGAKVGSRARMNISLFTDADSKGREYQMSQSDLAVFNEAKRSVPYLIEIETGKQVKPKTPAGIIATTNMCRWFYPAMDCSTKYDLSGSTLFVVLCSKSFSNQRSKKLLQLQTFQSAFKLPDGCLNNWVVCFGDSVDSTFESWREQFLSNQRVVLGQPEQH